ncbi:hypothetical protein BCR33DRAFT_714209 [Rhizoclosmatium globosum]|uniref:Uncharacterized protein n=1 Tax=Rhizoclosmatium globosum TaxID=329046 RepID=A0A1Y2CQR0_9FUNG|nr:hypothetical protein BCR33DRAFT_714209 [Rhizoclosmatium globosum]|eukprot:ORY49174.1 hypothetical protein BCR33DRAFT_714209 [Rhizoclosmatium globosum]
MVGIPRRLTTPSPHHQTIAAASSHVESTADTIRFDIVVKRALYLMPFQAAHTKQPLKCLGLDMA